MSLRTTSDLFAHSLQVLREHHRLLAFPLLSMVAGLTIAALLLPPLFHVSTTQMWNWLWHPGSDQQALRDAVALLRSRQFPRQWLLLAWLLGVFAHTFIRFACYTQAIGALNGGQASIGRGLSFAVARLPSIAAWALFAGTVGMVARIIERYLGVLAGMILNLIGVSRIMGRDIVGPVVWLGVSWSVVAQFVIPVMLNQPQVINPVENLKISARMLRRLWNDGTEDALVIGLVGPGSIGFITAGGVLAVFMFAGFASHQAGLYLWGVICSFAICCLTDAVNGVFRCGLYIYATEGVLPGPFDADLFNRAWSVQAGPQPS